MTTFEFDIKAGNRATRRLGKPSIGRMARTVTNARFDPNAFDGDGDNLVQDNTPFERPALPTSIPQGLASVSSSRNQTDNRLASLPINPERVRPRISLRKNNPTVQRVRGKRPKGYRDHLRGKSVNEIAMLSTPSSDRQVILDYVLHRTGTPEQWSANDMYEDDYANQLKQGTAGIAELTSGAYGFEVKPSYSPENVAMAQELITETLNNNPLFNEIVQRFGMPNVIVVDGPNDWSGIYTNHTNTIHIDKDTYQRYKREALERGPGIRPENEVAIGDTADGRKILTRLLTDGTNPGTLAHEYGHYLHELLRLQKEYGRNRRNHFLYPTDDEQNHPLTQTGIREAFGNSQVGSIGAGRGSTAQNMDALWADSVYAETNPDELFAEAFSALMRMYNEGDNSPEVLVNSYTVNYFADLLGLPTKKALTANKVTLGLPEEELLSDGRPLLPMRPRSVPNVDPKSSNRLHNASEPIAVSYGRNRQGLFSVGDHRFYDSRNPSLYLVGDKRVQQMANDAGQRYVNDRTHSSIVRALSGVQFGLPLVDMPLVGNENSDDLGVLEAVITGEIARLPNNQRSRIELALKDATDISIGINESAKTKEPIYRSIVGGNKNGLKRSLEVGDEFPMPITSFSKDDDPDASVVLKIQNGAKALNIGDENLTQGTFKVLAINDKDGKLSVELEHVETFDPRHDAMRRVTGDDRPSTMRTRGLSSRRYTNNEAAAIEQDRNSRASITSYKRTLSDDDSKMLEELMDYSKISTNNLISGIKDKVERFVQDKITARLVKQEKLMKELYGDDKPYIDDAKIIKEWALGGPKPTGDEARVLKAAIERAYLHEKKIPIGDEIGTVKIAVEILSGKNIRVEGTVEIEREGRSFVVASFDRTLIAKHDPNRELSPRMREENIAAVNHNNMMVEPAFKQFGIANLINGHSYAWLARAGFDKIELGAASDGHYVWSLLGFSPSPENHDSRVNSLISPLREELKKFLEGGSDIIPNEATAIRIAWWVRNAEIQGPQAVSLVTLANSFELTKDNKNALVDFFRWNRAGDGGLELRLDDKPTSYMPYHVLPDRATAEFIQSNDNLGLRSRSRNASTSKLHLINRKDMSQPITREQASYLATAYRDAEFTHSSEPDFNFSNPRDHTMMPIFEASGYNLQPSLVTKANAVALLSKVNDDGKPLYIPISRGYGLNAKTADMRVDAAARQWSTGPRDLSDRYDSLIFGGGDYFSTEPANWSLYYSSEDADGTVKTPFDRSNKSGLLVLVPPAARIGTYDDYLQTRRQLSDLIDPDVPTVSGYQWMDDSFRGEEGLERLFKNYIRANTKEEQTVRRASLFSSNANKPTSAILALIYELEDSKTPENGLEITRIQRLLARPTMPLYGVLNGLDAYETGTGAMVVLNRSAMVSVDEPMSLPEINEIVAEAVSADGKQIHPNFSRKYKQVESDFSPDYSRNFMGSYGDKIKEGKDKARGLRSRSDKNIWKTIGDELRSNRVNAPNFMTDPSRIQRAVKQLVGEYNFMTEELKNLESRLENADNDALTPDEVAVITKDIALIVEKLKQTENTWSTYIGVANKLSRRHILVTARKTAILQILKKAEAHLGEQYENHPFVKKLRKELDKIAKLFDTPSTEYIEGSKFRRDDIGLKDATDYAKLIRQTLAAAGGPALGRLGFPEQEDDQDTLMDDEDDALRELMLDAEDAKAISLDEPDFNEPQTPRQSNTPDGVPTDVMRKVKAMLARARHKNTPPAEAEVAERKARDFIGRYRPDLAENDGYMRGLRSRSKPTGLRSGFQPRPMPSNMEQAYYKEKYKNAFGQYNKIQEQMPNADDFFPELIDISTSDEPEIDRARNMSSLGWATKEFDDATNQWIADNPEKHERMMLVAGSMDDLLGKLNKVGDEDLISRIGKINTQLSRGMLTQNEYYSYLSTLMTNHEPEVRDNTNRGLRSSSRGLQSRRVGGEYRIVGGEEDQEILTLLASGMTVEEIAKKLNKSTTGINLRMRMIRETGADIPKPNSPKRNSLNEARNLRRELRLNKFLEFRNQAVVSPGQVSRLLADLRRIDNNKNIKKHMKILEKENSGTFSDYVKESFGLNLDYTDGFMKLAQLIRLAPPSDRNGFRRGPEISKARYTTVNLMLLAGFSVRDIASGLDISSATVSKYKNEFTKVIERNLPQGNTNRGLRSQNRRRGLRSQILPIEPQFLPIENLTAARDPKVDTNLQTPKNWEARTNRRVVRKSGTTRVGQEMVTPLEVQLAIVEDYKDIKNTLVFIAKKHNVPVEYVSLLARQYKLPYRKNIRQNLTGVQRGNIVEAIKNGMPDKEIRETFNITKSVLKRLKYISETGTTRELRLSNKKIRREKVKEEIIKLFNEGLRITDIVRRTKTDFKFVGDLLLANTETRPKLIARRDGSDLIPRVRELFKNGLNITEIKNELKKDFKIIKKIIDEDEELSELQQERIRKRQNLVSIASELRAFLISGESYDAAMEKFNLTRTQINKFVQTDRKKNKGQPDIPQLPDRRGTRIHRPLKSERDNEIAKLYKQGASRAELMQMFGITTSRLTQILKTQRPKGLKSQQSKVVGYVGSPVLNLSEDGRISGRLLSTDMANELNTFKNNGRKFLGGLTPREKLKKLISENIASQMSDVTVEELEDLFMRVRETSGQGKGSRAGQYFFYNEDGDGVKINEVKQFLINRQGDLVYLGPSDVEGSDFAVIDGITNVTRSAVNGEFLKWNGIAWVKEGQEYYTLPSPEGYMAIKQAMVSQLVHSWAESSNDSNILSLAIQNAVEDLFQTKSTKWSDVGIVNRPTFIASQVDAIRADEKMQKVLKSFVKAQYDATQQYFKAKGIKTVTVFRGMHKNNAKWGTLPEAETRPQEITLNMRPLSSWSADIGVANQFAQEDGEYDDGIVFKCTFPVENVFSVPFTGVGCVDEDEVVVLGKPSKAEYMTGFQGNPYKGENYPETEEDYENKAYEDEVLSWADTDISLDKVDK